jgi:tRNA (guanine10-N2)-methyltransferase
MIEYEMSELVADLIKFAATYLVVGGRLVFWLPTLNDEYVAEDIPSHPSMQLIANSEQNFGKWSRRLITMEKIEQVENLSDNLVKICISKPGHSNFRTKYFK